jgi:hypothetical protein
MSGPYTHSWTPHYWPRRFRIVLDRSGGWPIYFQRSAPGVYHLWVWPLCVQVIVGPLPAAP